MTKRNIKPAQEGQVVRMAGSRKALPAEGDTVTWSPYWQRRLDDGSVVEVKEETKEVPNKAQNKQLEKTTAPVVADQTEVTQ